jgi:hypothetical protein
MIFYVLAVFDLSFPPFPGRINYNGNPVSPLPPSEKIP